VGKVEEAVRSTVTRFVRRELRSGVAPLARDVRELKRVVSSLSRAVASLEKSVGQQVRQAQAERARLQAPEAEVKAARMSPRLIRKLRARLKLTQGELAAILGVSSASVFAWESGRSAPRGGNRAALVALRKLGRRDIKRILAEKAEAAPAAKPAPAKAKRAKPRRKPVKRAKRRAKKK
jgi:DNA-binding transcriptional regulator YiaG